MPRIQGFVRPGWSFPLGVLLVVSRWSGWCSWFSSALLGPVPAGGAVCGPADVVRWWSGGQGGGPVGGLVGWWSGRWFGQYPVIGPVCRPVGDPFRWSGEVVVVWSVVWLLCCGGPLGGPLGGPVCGADITPLLFL